MKVLIAEDDATSRLMLDRMLTRWGYDTVAAEDGTRAWEILQGADAPRLAILDWRMPGLQGTDICRMLKERSDPRSTYLILLTSKSEHDDLINGFEAGADDYLTKPFDREELRARLQAGSRILRLQGALADRLNEIEDTLQRIQQLFLFGECPTDLHGVDVAAMTIPTSRAAGDFYDFYRFSPDCFDVVVGDVMGKGMKAALFGAAVATRFLRSLKQLILQHDAERRPAPESILNHVRTTLAGLLSELESFVTICYARFDMKRRELTYVDCGHLKTVHYQAPTGACTFLEGPNMPLGFVADETYVQCVTAFSPGDLFVFYSDGITEARSPAGEFFGEQRLAETIRNHRKASARQLNERIMTAVEAFTETSKLLDDATCVVVRVHTADACRDGSDRELQARSDLHQLSAIRRFIRGAVTSAPAIPVPDDSVAAIELAANEAIVNIIKHAYSGRSDGKMVIRAIVTPRAVSLHITHWGEGFRDRPVTAPAVDLDGTREGGFGLYIMQQLLDTVEYIENADGGHTVRLIKELKAPGKDTLNTEHSS